MDAAAEDNEVNQVGGAKIVLKQCPMQFGETINTTMNHNTPPDANILHNWGFKDNVIIYS